MPTLRGLPIGAGVLGFALTFQPHNGLEEIRRGCLGYRDQGIRRHNPYSGPASAYGTIGKATDAYLRMINEKGGINGRKIVFITYDDGYAPPKTTELTRKLVESDKVLLIFNTLGTPTNGAIHKYPMNGGCRTCFR